MTDQDPAPEEALTKEELESASEQPLTGEKLATLMAPKKRPPAPSKTSRSTGGGNPFKDRMGLGAYLGDPAAFPASVVIAHDDDFVVIHDKFPKATVHTLILPRSPDVHLLHPFDALADPAFLAQVKAQVARTKALVAGELQRQLGTFSKTEAARQAVLNGEEEEEEESGNAGKLPAGRDWESEVVCGVHAVPSMSHVHVHVLSRDMHSAKLKHRKHYNSFNTPFLVDIEDFPLAADDPRRNTRHEGYMQWDLRCWRCGRNFGNKFAQLKEHLEAEFDEWKRE